MLLLGRSIGHQDNPESRRTMQLKLGTTAASPQMTQRPTGGLVLLQLQYIQPDGWNAQVTPSSCRMAATIFDARRLRDSRIAVVSALYSSYDSSPGTGGAIRAPIITWKDHTTIRAGARAMDAAWRCAGDRPRIQQLTGIMQALAQACCIDLHAQEHPHKHKMKPSTHANDQIAGSVCSLITAAGKGADAAINKTMCPMQRWYQTLWPHRVGHSSGEKHHHHMHSDSRMHTDCVSPKAILANRAILLTSTNAMTIPYSCKGFPALPCCTGRGSWGAVGVQWPHLANSVGAQGDAHELHNLLQDDIGAVQGIHVPAPVPTLPKEALRCRVQRQNLHQAAFVN